MDTRRNAQWNHHPDLPIPVSPIMSWPPRPLAWLTWISRYWLAVSSVTIELAAAFAVYRWFQPDWETMRHLGPGWIFAIWARNMVLLTLVAGGLHLWFITLAAQGKELKFDARDQARSNGTFTFKNQVWDNMFWSYASGVTAWTLWEVLYFWAAANGYAPQVGLAEHPIWFVLWMVIIPLWSSLHFYWIHRLLHWPPMYRLAHNLHHRNINIGPWAGISMHPVETALYFSSVAIHFVVPSHPVHVLFHFYLEGLNPAFSHSGFEGVHAGDRKRLSAGDFFHQLHHRYFECNYGTAEIPWDKLFGSFHDGSEEATAATRARKKRMYG
ncbi:sterol desaturase family protein [Defluviimonas sp. D31]|uniref:sterol desaturase family protein n=1 Tax=Defluviimonas sp. D31 TaxID=3083253 RepID=UPI00296F3409|nr:sterol desaturase family protein [Defluviimonas sp. D31]MDW4551187.1 sterol desaturase family protein [Defluviimonas sp. D31]